MAEEFVVLVNKRNKPIGRALKSEVHYSNTPLHRGFSVFLFNQKGDLLLQQRSRFKKTWPLAWSNSCCGHPAPGEKTISAAKRRLTFELGFKKVKLFVILPNYRYRFERDGVVENEMCPVLVGFTKELASPNPQEVEAIEWRGWQDFLQDIKDNPGKYSEWCIEEAQFLSQNHKFQQLYKKYTALSKVK